MQTTVETTDACTRPSPLVRRVCTSGGDSPSSIVDKRTIHLTAVVAAIGTTRMEQLSHQPETRHRVSSVQMSSQDPNEEFRWMSIFGPYLTNIDND